MISNGIKIKRALLSVSDKTGLVEFAKKLQAYGVELISTGGTARILEEANLPVTHVQDLTKFPEMMDGRVKTLHPMIHGALLADRQNTAHTASMLEHNIAPIDLLVVNLYPFESTVNSGASEKSCIENIDIGGPAMIRAAAKNHAYVTVAVSPNDYKLVLNDIHDTQGEVCYETRQTLASNAFAHTATYDAAISNWFVKTLNISTPQHITVSGHLKQSLRYGENPHQSAAFYTDGSKQPGVATARQIQGKELSYNNIADTDAAFNLVSELEEPACAIIKHANPCGVSIDTNLCHAYNKAFACDTTSAFGGIIAFNRPLDEKTAKQVIRIFTEVVIAPDADQAALDVFKTKPNLRLLLTGECPDFSSKTHTIKQVTGGFLRQISDTHRIHPSNLKVVTKRAPTPQEIQDMLFAWQIAKHVKSNAIVYAKNNMTLGIGAGQMSRVDSTRIAAYKATEIQKVDGCDNIDVSLKDCVVASDAFFPFPDGLLNAAEAGASAVIQPGGSIRDKDVIAAADQAGLAMVFTGIRHFRH